MCECLRDEQGVFLKICDECFQVAMGIETEPVGDDFEVVFVDILERDGRGALLPPPAFPLTLRG